MRLSYSKIDTFLGCPRKYYKRYVLGIKDPGNPHAAFGSLCHEVLEEFVKGKFKDKNIMAAMLKKFLNESKEIPDKQKPYFLSEGLKIFNQFPIHALDYEKIIGTEKELTVKLTDQLELYSIIDRLDKPEESILEIIDYKSNGSVEPQKYLIQLKIYNFITSELFPEFARRVGKLHYLKFNKVLEFQLTNEGAANTKVWLVAVGNKMLELEAKHNEEAFPKDTTKASCKYCQFKKECWG